VLSGQILLKLGTNMHHVSGLPKRFSKVKGQGHDEELIYSGGGILRTVCVKTELCFFS